MILVDTNVISELVRPAPDPVVIAYLRGLAPNILFTATVCEAEIRYGLDRMSSGQRRDNLVTRVDRLFASAFENQIIAFDSQCAVLYGQIRSNREASGTPIQVQDAMIAATARAHGAALATRNAADFIGCGIEVINPWTNFVEKPRT